MKWLIGCLALSLTACASVELPEPIVRTVEVRVPIPVPCLPEGADLTGPDYPDTDEALLAAPDAAARYRLLFAGRGPRMAREAALVAMLGACQGSPHSEPGS